MILIINGNAMYNLKKIMLIAATVFISAISESSSVFSLNSLFTSNEKKAVINGNFLTSVTLKGRGDVRTEGVEISSPVKNSFIPVIATDFDMAAVEKGFFYMEGNKSNRIKIYRSLTDFSGLKGMNYHSHTEGGSIPLVTESYGIQSPDDYTKENINDKDIPETSKLHFAIKDNRLGLISFKSEFISIGRNFILINTSTGNVSKFGMDIFYPGDYIIYKILIYDRNLKGYFFYTVQFMKVRSDILSKINLIKPESFGNRVRAEDIHFLKSMGIDRSGKLAAFE